PDGVAVATDGPTNGDAGLVEVHPGEVTDCEDDVALKYCQTCRTWKASRVSHRQDQRIRSRSQWQVLDPQKTVALDQALRLGGHAVQIGNPRCHGRRRVIQQTAQGETAPAH